eukprot:CAMPEP_0117419652 /NCGR_PEP_ID=MMETSP0758-20121206/1166_1 /TAXON_ID=63605 /ORGANISM="Percolomonas cosmopolitus, Strain AE-1 (ATCC 50343)" /LENGTH=377 /DNA_ID=CAMNT_0005200835 /DNA_START=376 /DNA_END=1509 /DNA_ORIENTATION=+
MLEKNGMEIKKLEQKRDEVYKERSDKIQEYIDNSKLNEIDYDSLANNFLNEMNKDQVQKHDATIKNLARCIFENIHIEGNHDIGELYKSHHFLYERLDKIYAHIGALLKRHIYFERVQGLRDLPELEYDMLYEQLNKNPNYLSTIKEEINEENEFEKAIMENLKNLTHTVKKEQKRRKESKLDDTQKSIMRFMKGHFSENIKGNFFKFCIDQRAFYNKFPSNEFKNVVVAMDSEDLLSTWCRERDQREKWTTLNDQIVALKKEKESLRATYDDNRCSRDADYSILKSKHLDNIATLKKSHEAQLSALEQHHKEEIKRLKKQYDDQIKAKNEEIKTMKDNFDDLLKSLNKFPLSEPIKDMSNAPLILQECLDSLENLI